MDTKLSTQSDAVPGVCGGSSGDPPPSGDLAHLSTQWLLQPPLRQAEEALLRGQILAFILILGLVNMRQVCVSLDAPLPPVFVHF